MTTPDTSRPTMLSPLMQQAIGFEQKKLREYGKERLLRDFDYHRQVWLEIPEYEVAFNIDKGIESLVLKLWHAGHPTWVSCIGDDEFSDGLVYIGLHEDYQRFARWHPSLMQSVMDDIDSRGVDAALAPYWED